MTAQQTAWIKFAVLLALTAIGAGLAAYEAAPTAKGIAVAIAVVSALTLGLQSAPKDTGTIALQHATIDRLMSRISADDADRSKK
jgi:hypothetical protein